jgi:uncharacterized protein involved in copper resistance
MNLDHRRPDWPADTAQDRPALPPCSAAPRGSASPAAAGYAAHARKAEVADAALRSNYRPNTIEVSRRRR